MDSHPQNTPRFSRRLIVSPLFTLLIFFPYDNITFFVTGSSYCREDSRSIASTHYLGLISGMISNHFNITSPLLPEPCQFLSPTCLQARQSSYRIHKPCRGHCHSQSCYNPRQMLPVAASLTSSREPHRCEHGSQNQAYKERSPGQDRRDKRHFAVRSRQRSLCRNFNRIFLKFNVGLTSRNLRQ